MPPLAVLGIDPGLDVSHAAVVAMTPDGPRVSLTFTWDSPETGLLGPLALSPLCADFSPFFLAAAVVESARETVIKGRDADPVLRNAMMSGRLVEGLRAQLPGLPVLSVPAFGSVQGWNWRGEVGVAGMTDDGIRLFLERRLACTFPTGKRGGKASHYPDAAGIALAGLQRLTDAGVTVADLPTDVHAALHALSPLEQALVQGRQTRKAEKKRGRAVQKTWAAHL